MPVLPLFAAVPFAVSIATTSAPLARARADAHPEQKAVFPAPPALHTQVALCLCRMLRVRARRPLGEGAVEVSEQSEVLSILGGSLRADVETELPEREWVTHRGGGAGASQDAEVGAWRQRARFEGTLRLRVPPTFATELVQCEVRVYSASCSLPLLFSYTLRSSLLSLLSSLFALLSCRGEHTADGFASPTC